MRGALGPEVSTGNKYWKEIRGGKKEWLPVQLHEASGNSSPHRNCGNSLSLLLSL